MADAIVDVVTTLEHDKRPLTEAQHATLVAVFMTHLGPIDAAMKRDARLGELIRDTKDAA